MLILVRNIYTNKCFDGLDYTNANLFTKKDWIYQTSNFIQNTGFTPATNLFFKISFTSSLSPLLLIICKVEEFFKPWKKLFILYQYEMMMIIVHSIIYQMYQNIYITLKC